MTNVFPLAMVVLSFLASIIYAIDGDILKVVYFFCGAMITLSVMLMK
jgi:hypothetical protein